MLRGSEVVAHGICKRFRLYNVIIKTCIGCIHSNYTYLECGSIKGEPNVVGKDGVGGCCWSPPGDEVAFAISGWRKFLRCSIRSWYWFKHLLSKSGRVSICSYVNEILKEEIFKMLSDQHKSCNKFHRQGLLLSLFIWNAEICLQRYNL